MKKNILLKKIILIVFLLFLSTSETAAQNSGNNKNNPAEKVENTKKAVLVNQSGEVEEALIFLNQINKSLDSLKIYKLAETERTTTSPQIADKIITSGKDAKKLKKIADKVLKYHKLADHCTVLLFDSDVPTVFTYKLRSISFSTAIFKLLSKEETAALIAHEIGHLYFGKELADARFNENARSSRITELKCDIIAFVTLKNLKIKQTALISAVMKLIAAREKLSLETTGDQSPELTDRIYLAERFSKIKN